jgi:hypothetical protein
MRFGKHYSQGTVHDELLSAVDERCETDRAFIEKMSRENGRLT